MEVRTVNKPKIDENGVLIRVKVTGICGSDIHVQNWDTNLPINPPVIIGHEFSGEVVEVGSSVEGFEVGDRVVPETSYHVCGVCLPCRTGRYNACAERLILGYSFDGGFAEYCAVPSRLVHHLPDNVSFEAGALCEPLAACLNGIFDRTEITPGDIVAIAGPGPIGLLCLQLVKSQGAYVILCGASGDEERLDLGKKLGADVVLNVEEQDPIDAISELTDGTGCDAFIECSGSPAAVHMGLEITCRLGQYTQIGLFGHDVAIDLDIYSCQGCFLGRKIQERSIRFLGDFGTNLRRLSR